MKSETVVRLFLLVGFTGIYGACIPYVVGSTSRTAPEGVTQQTVSTYIIPHTLELQKLPSDGAKIGLDVEARRGLSPRSDVGIRFASGSGVTLSYKRRLDGESNKLGPGVAIQVGGGIVDYATHGEGEATLIVSGGEKRRLTPYGGLRVVGTIPLTEDAQYDEPVYGGFTGVRLGSSDLGISAEVGVFRDKNQYVNFGRNIIVVPSISIHFDFLKALQRPRSAR
ncbi:MAG: hypothetical protein ABJB74_14585 [Gemmatimonas sp.]